MQCISAGHARCSLRPGMHLLNRSYHLLKTSREGRHGSMMLRTLVLRTLVLISAQACLRAIFFTARQPLLPVRSASSLEAPPHPR